MYRNIIFGLLVFVMCSCSSLPHYQICSVSSSLAKSSSGSYEYKNTNCEVLYNFWSEGGLVSFIIHNISDDIMYVDLSKSFLIRNGVAYDYFLNRVISSSSSFTSLESNIISGSALGYWNFYGKKVPGSITASSGASLGSSKSNSLSYKEKSIVAIPPHASKIFSEYRLMNSRYIDCDLYENTSKKEVASMTFTESSTPLYFSNYVCYRIGNIPEEFVIDNTFYISQVENQHYKATLEKEEMGCPNELKKKVEVFNNSSPSQFYIPYQPREQKKPSTLRKTSEQKKKFLWQLGAEPKLGDAIYGD